MDATYAILKSALNSQNVDFFQSKIAYCMNERLEFLRESDKNFVILWFGMIHWIPSTYVTSVMLSNLWTEVEMIKEGWGKKTKGKKEILTILEVLFKRFQF